jgi:hypothetical protein
MPKAELKTKKTHKSVDAFLMHITDEKQRQDSFTILEIMRNITKAEPKMWGNGIIGFGDYHYRYESGREGDWFLTGFSPRKQNLALYIMSGFDDSDDLMGKLGKYKTGKSCLYIKRLDDVHLPSLKKLIKRSVEYIRKKYST